ncbi:signal peptidase I [Massilia glaciei]|uniref:Signal peptidase I n=1 Tax=Massilia glaciei TaxID=1524097 RepID=A0A2U2HMK7_9BURK|nr:signal peptidase I [Massilia glaciei]PWF48666.1 signal peptidase I [Massilia glaciei]
MKNWARANKGFLLFLMLFGVFRTAIADWNPVPTGSMRPTIVEGDVVLVNRIAYDLKVPLTGVVIAHLGEPRRGDIVTFHSPRGGTRLIKRVIGLPGDVVEMRAGRLRINGLASAYLPLGRSPEPVAPRLETAALRFDETLAQGHHSIQLMPDYAARRDFGPVTIPRDEFMMLGDNRDNSADSRVIGLVPRALLIGRAERVLVSADMLGNWMPRAERFGKSLGR